MTQNKKLLLYVGLGGLVYWLLKRQSAPAIATQMSGADLPAILEPANYDALSFPAYAGTGSGLNPAVTLR
jgi:hypothetical protein